MSNYKGKKVYAPFRNFEGKKPKEQHVRLTKSMLTNPNWLALMPSSIKLYLDMRLTSNGAEEVTYSKSFASRVVSPSTYNRVIKDLTVHGFIIKTGYASNGGGHAPNVFKFDSRWQDNNH